MPNFGSDQSNYRKVSYICVGCNKNRSVIVDETQHLEREELKVNGLAPYIDVHQDLSTSDEERKEHGIKLYIDNDFSVRSNDLLADITKPKMKKGLPGLPSPEINIENEKLLYPSKSWNSLEISSKQHNLGYFVVNTDPTTDEQDNPPINITSTLNTVTGTMSYRQSILDQKNKEHCKAWIELLLEWIESTASLNAKVIPSILRYIDKQYDRDPSVVDELAIPIIIDKTTKVLLKDDDKLMDDIIGTTINDPYNMGVFYPDQSVDYETFFMVSEKFSLNEYVSLNEIVKMLFEETENREKTMDSFVIFFFELIENDLIEYRVSYLL